MDLQAEVEKLDLQFGDVLLVRCPTDDCMHCIEEMKHALSSIGNRGVLALIVPPDFDIRKLDDEEKQHLAQIVDECAIHG